MKKIKIFLASSITDLRLDRLEVGDFIRQLNEIYFDRGVQFFLGKCEDYDNAISSEGKQSEFDREIRDSELCFFLFFKKVGDYTRHEFEVALDAFKQSKKPKIVTYFKYVDSPDEAEGDVKAFMRMLDGELKHYYNIYKSIDTLKLGILMQIKLMGLDTEEPKVEQGKVTFGGQVVADTAALPVFAGNASLAELKEKHKTLTQRYYELREKLSSDLGDEAAEEEYRKVASERAATEKEIREAEKGVLGAMKSMLQKTAKGELSPRQTAAYRAFEHGDYKDALEILDLGEIMAELSHSGALAEGAVGQVQVNVNELLQRVEVLQANGVDKAAAAEIAQIYETAAERIEKYNLKKDALYDYVVFLFRQNDYGKAIKVAERLAYYYADPALSVPAARRAALYNVLGGLYRGTGRFSEAEQMHAKALETIGQNAAGDAVLLTNLALTYSDLGLLYADTQRFSEAEAAYGKARDILESLAKQNPAAYERELSAVYGNLGVLYKTTGRPAEAEAAYRKAIEIYERLAKRNPAMYEAALATGLGNLGILLYWKLGRKAEGEEAQLRAIGIRERLAERNPAAYEPDLAISYNNLANLYCDLGRLGEAETAFKRTIELRERLAKADPAAFEGSLAGSYSNLGNFYWVRKNYAEAETAYRKSIEICARLTERNPAVYEPDLAASYCNLGCLYRSAGRQAEAKAALLRSLEIYERLTGRNPAAFEPGLAVCCTNLGKVYSGTGRYDEAETALARAADIYERLAVGTPAEFGWKSALSYYDLALLFKGNSPKRIAFSKKAYEIAKQYPQNSSCARIVAELKPRFGDAP